MCEIWLCRECGRLQPPSGNTVREVCCDHQLRLNPRQPRDKVNPNCLDVVIRLAILPAYKVCKPTRCEPCSLGLDTYHIPYQPAVQPMRKPMRKRKLKPKPKPQSQAPELKTGPQFILSHGSPHTGGFAVPASPIQSSQSLDQAPQQALEPVIRWPGPQWISSQTVRPGEDFVTTDFLFLQPPESRQQVSQQAPMPTSRWTGNQPLEQTSANAGGLEEPYYHYFLPNEGLQTPLLSTASTNPRPRPAPVSSLILPRATGTSSSNRIRK